MIIVFGVVVGIGWVVVEVIVADFVVGSIVAFVVVADFVVDSNVAFVVSFFVVEIIDWIGDPSSALTTVKEE